MRMVWLGAAAALAAALVPEGVEACFHIENEVLTLALERVEIDGAESADRAAYEGFEVTVTSYGDGALEWDANDGAEGYHASYHAAR